MSRTSKTDLRLAAYADVDETNSHIGVALGAFEFPVEVSDLLLAIQNDLFDVGADLSVPLEATGDHHLRVTAHYIERLETACDQFNKLLAPMDSFVLPGGAMAAAQLHVARTVARRAERSVWAAIAVHGDSVNRLAAQYLNRLSDLLFILARVANLETGDVKWTPGANR